MQCFRVLYHELSYKSFSRYQVASGIFRTTRERCITIIYHAIESTVVNTINGTYVWCTMGRLDVTPSKILPAFLYQDWLYRIYHFSILWVRLLIRYDPFLLGWLLSLERSSFNFLFFFPFFFQNRQCNRQHALYDGKIHKQPGGYCQWTNKTTAEWKIQDRWTSSQDASKVNYY